MSSDAHARSIAAWNLASRITGFGRVLAIGAVLGKTDLGNTYQSANMVSTVLFELLVAGTLSASLVPELVRAGPERERQLCRSLVTVIGVAMAVLALVMALAASPIMRALTAAVDRPDVRAEEIRLGSTWLRLFAPQLLAYGVAAVASAALAAQRRFVAAAAGPLVNNVVVMAAAGFVWLQTRGDRLAFPLDTEPTLVLGIGTTLGVVALAAVPAIALGWSWLAPTTRWRSRELARIWRAGVWSSGTFAAFHVLGLAAVVVSSRVPGGAVAFTTAVAFAAVPHALVVHPIVTSRYPGLVAAAAEGTQQFTEAGRSLVARLLGFVVPVTGVGAIAAIPAMVVVTFGSLSDVQSGVRIGPVLAILCLGLVGRALFDSFQRVSYAASDVRSPTWAALVGLGVAVVVMAAASRMSAQRLVWTTAVGYVAGQIVMGLGCVYASYRRGERLVTRASLVGAVRSLALVAPSGLVLWFGSWNGRADALVAVVGIALVAGIGWHFTQRRGSPTVAGVVDG